MIVYLDLVFIINFIFDFCILTTVDLLLKRDTNIYRIIVGSLLGELSMITLFVDFNNIELTLFKVVLGFIMCIVTYKYRSIKYTMYNSIYLYLVGIILGGFIYYLLNEFKAGLEYSIKYLVIMLLSPLSLFIYYRLTMRFRNDYNNRYKLYFKYGEYEYRGVAFLDSGNKLASPISGKPIILVEKEYIKDCKLKLLPVSFNALNHHGIVFCFKPSVVYINDRVIDNVLIGISDIKFNIEGCSALLNARLEI